jgi:hypothetical protein
MNKTASNGTKNTAKLIILPRKPVSSKGFTVWPPGKKALDTRCCTFFLGMRIVNYRETVDPEAGGLDWTATLVGAKK